MTRTNDPVSAGVEERLTFPAIETHLIGSKHVAQTFRISVMRPPQRRRETRRYPVVYATDGNALFDVLKGLSWMMQAFERRSVQYILVAIGYPGDSPLAGERLRGRDLAIPGCPDFLGGHELFALWEDILAVEQGTRTFCGAVEFQQFVGSELIPFIDERYPSIADDRTYFGHSLGGGFGLFTLFTQTQLFRNYILSSPTTQYHGETPSGARCERHDFMSQRVKEYASTRRSLGAIRLYMSVGAEEEFEPLVANWQFTSSFYRMAALMKAAAIPGLQIRTEVFAGESHATVWPLAFTHGIRSMFGTDEHETTV